MKSNQQGNTTIVLAAILVALIGAAWLMLGRQSIVAPGPTPTPMIQNTTELDKTSKDLDSVNLNSLDNDLNQVGKDAAAI